MRPVYYDLQRKIRNRPITAHTEAQPQQLEATVPLRQKKKHQNDRSRTRRTAEVPFIAGRSHFTRKNTRFRAQTISQNKAHATSMQPLQCVLQPHVANPQLSTHMTTQHENSHAASLLRSAT